jgi:hypothetical protein
MLKHPTELLYFSSVPWSMSRLTQHLLTCASKEHEIFFIEDPVMKSNDSKLEIRCDPSGVRVVIPYLPSCLDAADSQQEFSLLLQRLLEHHQVINYQLWANTTKPVPALVSLAKNYRPDLVVYDYTNEPGPVLANLAFLEYEDYLSAWSDIIFACTPSVYHTKRKQHHHVYLFARNDKQPPYQVQQKLAFPGYQGAMAQQKAFIGFMNEKMQMEYIWHSMSKILKSAWADKQGVYLPARLHESRTRAPKAAAS